MTVLTFVPPPPPPERRVDDDVVAQIEILLDLAKQGAVSSLAYVAVGDPTAAPATGRSGPHRNALIAGAAMLLNETIWVKMP